MSVAFWTWLWGPLGLLMATPLTVCLVVLGKHVPGLEFVGTLMADTPAPAPDHGFYQRLLARDQGEAAAQPLIEDPIFRQAAPRRISRAANSRGPVGTAGSRGREHTGATRCRSESRGLDVGADARIRSAASRRFHGSPSWPRPPDLTSVPETRSRAEGARRV
jgi:hypothetical protein